jgi:hypothetical protein
MPLADEKFGVGALLNKRHPCSVCNWADAIAVEDLTFSPGKWCWSFC